MPIIAFACPPHKQKYGTFHSPEYCISECTEQCYSPHLMAAIVAVNQKNHHKGRYISATSLAGCARKLHLERTVDYAEEYQNLYAAFRGTITHTVVEEAATVQLPSGKSLADLGFVTEWNMKIGFCLRAGHGGWPIDPATDVDDLASYANLACPDCVAEGRLGNEEAIILGGTLDGLGPIWTDFDPETGVLPCRLYDIKTQKEYALSMFIKGDPKNTLHPLIKDDYVAQARVYAYLASHSTPPESLQQRGVKRVSVVESHIQAFAMGEAPWTGGGPYRWRTSWQSPYKDWPMYPNDLGDVAWVVEYIRTNARPIFDSLIEGKTRGPVCLPEKSSKGSHSWRCDFCAFHGSEYCPNPALEYEQIQAGVDPEEAFRVAAASPVVPEIPDVASLTEADTLVVDNFFRRQRGEAPVELEKPKRGRKKATTD